MKRCSAYKYQRVSFRFQATLSRLQSKTKKKKRTISCEELFSFNYFGVKEKSIFYKCKLDIEVRVYCSKQVMRANAFSRKPPTDFKRNSASLIRRLNYELCARKTQVHSMPMFTALSRRDITKSWHRLPTILATNEFSRVLNRYIMYFLYLYRLIGQIHRLLIYIRRVNFDDARSMKV